MTSAVQRVIMLIPKADEARSDWRWRFGGLKGAEQLWKGMIILNQYFPRIYWFFFEEFSNRGFLSFFFFMCEIEYLFVVGRSWRGQDRKSIKYPLHCSQNVLLSKGLRKWQKVVFVLGKRRGRIRRWFFGKHSWKSIISIQDKPPCK